MINLRYHLRTFWWPWLCPDLKWSKVHLHLHSDWKVLFLSGRGLEQVSVAGSRGPGESLLLCCHLRGDQQQLQMSGQIHYGWPFCLSLEKKSRKRKPLTSPPPLLVQDSNTTGRQIEDRVAQLLLEEVELCSTPPLPASRILREKLEEAGWHLQLPEGKENFLWEGSALTGAWAMESFYTAGLVPPIVPQQPTKVSLASPGTHWVGFGRGGKFWKCSR